MSLDPKTMSRIRARILMMEAETDKLARELAAAQARAERQREVDHLAALIYWYSLRPERPSPEVNRAVQAMFDAADRIERERSRGLPLKP